MPAIDVADPLARPRTDCRGPVTSPVGVPALSREHGTLRPENYFEKFVGLLDERTANTIAPVRAAGDTTFGTKES